MNFVSTETPTFNTTARADGSPFVIETVELKGRDGNVLMTFQKSADGTFSMVGTGDISDGTNTLSTVAELATNLSTGLSFALPTEDPAVEGVLWSDAGIVTVSAGE